MIKISPEDAILFKNLYLSKGYDARRLLSEFSDEDWKLGSIDTLLKKIRRTVTSDGQPWQWQTAFCACQREHWECRRPMPSPSQEDNPKTHRSIREISCETGIHRLTVHRIIHRDLQLKCVVSKSLCVNRYCLTLFNHKTILLRLPLNMSLCALWFPKVVQLH